jgi:hypothetical protein
MEEAIGLRWEALLAEAYGRAKTNARSL